MEKRTKILTISAEVLVGLLLTVQKGEWIGIEGIPEDISILNSHYDLARMQFQVLCESKEWEVVPPGAFSPELYPIVKSYSTQAWASGLQVATPLPEARPTGPLGRVRPPQDLDF